MNQKLDTGFVTSMDAVEVELDLEGDIEADFTAEKARAPLKSGQFALTQLREKKEVYIQSLAEAYSRGINQVDWRVGDEWKAWDEMTRLEQANANHFRVAKVNAVVNNASLQKPVEGKVFTATVPKRPLSLYSDMGRKCEGGDGHIQASSSTYWYVWEPEKSTCTVDKVTVTATVTKVFPKGELVYPEYDRLYNDHQLDVIVFFGAVENSEPSDYAYDIIRMFKSQLRYAGFVEQKAEKGVRMTRTANGITANIDIYSPTEFSGLGDYANRQNFFDGVNSHEVIIFNGHSMLGSSEFWANKAIYEQPTKYQVFIYNGCLGYEYYVDPILTGKQGAVNTDIVSNVLETPFTIMPGVAATSIAMLLSNADKGGTTPWQEILGRINGISSYGAHYGVSGARDNSYKPTSVN